jgi:hypothetical protein
MTWRAMSAWPIGCHVIDTRLKKSFLSQMAPYGVTINTSVRTWGRALRWGDFRPVAMELGQFLRFNGTAWRMLPAASFNVFGASFID